MTLKTLVQAEIYTDAYDVKDVIEFHDANMTVIRPYLATGEKDDDRVTLILEDDKNEFWPVIIRLDNIQAGTLADNILKAIKHSYKNEQQFVARVH